MTLKEYLEDYASPKTKEIGEALIQKELNVITNPKVKEKAAEYIANIHNGQREFPVLGNSTSCVFFLEKRTILCYLRISKIKAVHRESSNECTGQSRAGSS